ncbi:MAG: ABC transporter permease [Pseudomonadota bacterium]
MAIAGDASVSQRSEPRSGSGFLWPFAFVVAVLVVWQAAILVFAIPPFLMPSPIATLAAFGAHGETIAAALAYTAFSGFAGLVVAFFLALILAAGFVASDTLTRATLPLVIIVRTAPVLAIAPILIMTFGRGLATSIVVVVIIAFFPMMVNAMRGLRSTRPAALELMHVLGADWRQTFFTVRMPFALPYLFTGLRAAGASAFLSAMLAEWLSGAPGLGALILDAAARQTLDLLWAAVISSMALSFSVFALTTFLERRALKWRT